MRWQNPIAWIGMAALLLPVLIHLFSRRQTRTLPFPSLRFVSPSPLLPTRRTQLSDVALLLLRLVILAVAVAALAAPRLERRDADASSSARTSVNAGVSTDSTERNGLVPLVVIVDTSLDAAADSARRARRDLRVDTLVAERRSVLVVRTAVPHATLAGAHSWLQQQPGRGTIVGDMVIVSDFGPGTVDSTDLAALSSNVRISLERAAVVGDSVAAPSTDPALEGRGAGLGARASASAVRWWIGTDTSGSDAVRRAVRARGGEVAMTDAAATRRVVVAASNAPGIDSAMAHAAPLSAPWMGDLIAVVLQDTMLRSALGSTSNAFSNSISGSLEQDSTSFADSFASTPFTVIARTPTGAPLLAAAAWVDNRGDQLLVLSRMPPTSLATAALLLATSRALSAMSSSLTATPATASASPTNAMLRNWEQAPAADIPLMRDVRHHDANSGPSDGRYLWALVLLLLGAEAVMRRARVTNVPRVAHIAPERHD